MTCHPRCKDAYCYYPGLFRLQSSHHGESWEWLGLQYTNADDAIDRAIDCACDAIAYGTVRIIGPNGKEFVRYAAGTGKGIKDGRYPRRPRVLSDYLIGVDSAGFVPPNQRGTQKRRADGCILDTDGDGNCPKHQAGCNDAADALAYATFAIDELTEPWPPAWTGWNKQPRYWPSDMETWGPPQIKIPQRYVEEGDGLLRDEIMPGYQHDGWRVTETSRCFKERRFTVRWERVEPPFFDAPTLPSSIDVQNGKGYEHHLSFEGATVDYFIHACEAWMLGEGLQIPPKNRERLYEAMQDQFMDSEEYKLWRANIKEFYKTVYAKRDNR